MCEYLWIFVNVCLADFGRELRMMVFSIMNCLKSVLWIILILFILFYMFGIIFVSGVMGYLDTLELRQLPRYDTWPPDSSNVFWISRLRGWENTGRSPFLRNDEPPRFILWEAPKWLPISCRCRHRVVKRTPWRIWRSDQPTGLPPIAVLACFGQYERWTMQDTLAQWIFFISHLPLQTNNCKPTSCAVWFSY